MSDYLGVNLEFEDFDRLLKQDELVELKFPNYMNVMYKDKGKYYQNLWDKRKVYVSEY